MCAKELQLVLVLIPVTFRSKTNYFPLQNQLVSVVQPISFPTKTN